MMTTVRDSVKGSALSEEYIRSIASSRYSSRKYNSGENLGEVSAIDLVDDQHEELIRMCAGVVGQAAHRARFEFEADLTIAARGGPEAFEEILVTVGRWNTRDGDVVRPGEMPSQHPSRCTSSRYRAARRRSAAADHAADRYTGPANRDPHATSPPALGPDPRWRIPLRKNHFRHPTPRPRRYHVHLFQVPCPSAASEASTSAPTVLGRNRRGRVVPARKRG